MRDRADKWGMKYLLIVLTLLGGCAGASEDACVVDDTAKFAATPGTRCSAGGALGRWVNVSLNEVLEFRNDCTYTSSYCKSSGLVIDMCSTCSTFHFTPEEVAADAPASCPSTQSCTFQVTGSGSSKILKINCGSGDVFYTGA